MNVAGGRPLDYWARVQGRVWLLSIVARHGDARHRDGKTPGAEGRCCAEGGKTALLACCGNPCYCPEHRPMVRPGKHADRLVVWPGRSGDVRARRNGGVVKWAQTEPNTHKRKGVNHKAGVWDSSCSTNMSRPESSTGPSGALWKQGTPRPGVETTAAVGPVGRHPWVRGLWERKEAGFGGGSVLARARPVYLCFGA